MQHQRKIQTVQKSGDKVKEREMRILNANSLGAKEDLLEMITKLKPDQTLETVNTWLTLSLGTDLFNAWIGVEKGEPVGMVTAEIVNADGPTTYIAFNYIKPGVKGNEELVKRVEDWAKEMETNKILYYTKRSPATFIKKFGFQLVQSVLKKDIKDGTI